LPTFRQRVGNASTSDEDADAVHGWPGHQMMKLATDSKLITVYQDREELPNAQTYCIGNTNGDHTQRGTARVQTLDAAVGKGSIAMPRCD
jgi:hypothetical protein